MLQALDAYEKQMTDRAKRYLAFDKFYGGAKKLFESHAGSTPESKRLDNLYSLRICPGGRHGGLDKRKVEVFYGNRPFDSVIKVAGNFQTTEKLETAHGATLSYQRTDDGQVLCCLYPAASENFRPLEDFILLDMVKNPAKIERESKRHWRMFLAYMEATCLDGKPSFFQTISVFYLRNFKSCVVDKTLQKRKASIFFGEIAKYTATVGLSGFIILFVTWAKDSSNSERAEEKHREVLNVYSKIQTNTQSIAERSKAIDTRIKNTSEKLKALNAAVLENTTLIERAVSEFKLSGEAENSNAQKMAK